MPLNKRPAILSRMPFCLEHGPLEKIQRLKGLLGHESREDLAKNAVVNGVVSDPTLLVFKVKVVSQHGGQSHLISAKCPLMYGSDGNRFAKSTYPSDEIFVLLC